MFNIADNVHLYKCTFYISTPSNLEGFIQKEGHRSLIYGCRPLGKLNKLWNCKQSSFLKEIVLIPTWTMAGIIPPIRPNMAGHHPDRSPYSSNLVELVDTFVLTQDRADVMNGFLDYRAALHASGIASGFQWLDGSYLENIEDLEGRPPNDIDVVTFFELPQGQTQTTMLPVLNVLFDPLQTKQNFRVDGYPFVLNQPMTEGLVRQTAYWYSMWSHRRDGLWKGFVQVDLDPTLDAPGRALLAQKTAVGFGP